MATAGTMEFGELTRRHGVKVQCSLSVEDCSLAIGEVVGHEHIKSASRMNNAIVVFLGSVDKAREIISSGIVVNDTLTPVLPLSTPATKVIISNVPPFISDDMIESHLMRYGRIVSPMRKISLGCKSPLLKHVVSFRRQVYMVLDQDDGHLDLTMKLKVGGFEYTVYATSNTTLVCFFCNMSGHVARDCVRKRQSETRPLNGSAGSKEDGSPEADVSAVSAPPTPLTEPSQAPSSGSLAAPNKVTSVPLDNDLRTPDDGAPAPEAGSPVCSKAELVSLSAEGSVSLATDDSLPSAEPMPNKAAVNEMITKELAALSETKSSIAPIIVDSSSNTETEEVVEMDTDGGFKAPKRKDRAADPADCNPSKTKKVGATSTACDSDNESVCSTMSDSSLADLFGSSGETVVHYKAEDISRFLHDTKGQRCVEVEQFFPDRCQFINDVACLIKEQAFTSTETARLRKLLTKLRKKVRHETSPSSQT